MRLWPGDHDVGNDIGRAAVEHLQWRCVGIWAHYVCVRARACVCMGVFLCVCARARRGARQGLGIRV
jgi:hypothetical protein